MSGFGAFEAAVWAGVLASGERHRALPRSIVETAQASFTAGAATLHARARPSAGLRLLEALEEDLR